MRPQRIENLFKAARSGSMHHYQPITADMDTAHPTMDLFDDDREQLDAALDALQYLSDSSDSSYHGVL